MNYVKYEGLEKINLDNVEKITRKGRQITLSLVSGDSVLWELPTEQEAEALDKKLDALTSVKLIHLGAEPTSDTES